MLPATQGHNFPFTVIEVNTAFREYLELHLPGGQSTLRNRGFAKDWICTSYGVKVICDCHICNSKNT